jgi:galactokinase
MRWRAPGRVNLIGDHTDYNEGFALPMAIQLECVVEGKAAEDEITLRSDARPRELRIPADGGAPPARVDPHWGRYVAGVARTLADRGRNPVGFEGTIRSTVPVGSGLSSSAALEVSCALALCEVGGLTLEPVELARACQQAEQAATGVPSGIMDQLASVAGRAGHALLIDCRSLEVTPVPVGAEVAVLVVHSGQERTLEGSAYAERRADCERIAALLGLRALRDATEEQVSDEPIARHVVAENRRVHAFAQALAHGNADEAGRLCDESHASLRDDFRVSTPQLDELVRRLRAGGALGARLTGAGFGGAVVALARPEDADRILDELRPDYPQGWRVEAVAGASRVE